MYAPTSIEALGAISGEEIENLIESIYQRRQPGAEVGAVDAMGRSCNELWLPIVLREMREPRAGNAPCRRLRRGRNRRRGGH